MKIYFLFFCKKVLPLIILIPIVVSVYGVFKPLPKDTSLNGPVRNVEDITFLRDLTYQKNGETVRDQQIFKEVDKLIQDADEFIVMDMFLFNDEYERKVKYPTISSDLTKALIEKKKQNKSIQIVVITDPINTFYGSYPSVFLEKLKENNIQVITTDLKKLRDSNPTYSGFWRSYLQWFKPSHNGGLPNAFSPDSPTVSLASYLDLLNFKANHRKVVITEKEAVVSSANPHDASGYHSNIAFKVKGKIVEDLYKSEQAVAKLSGGTLENRTFKTENKGEYEVNLITEGKIRESIIQGIRQSKSDDVLWMGVFYLSDRKVIKELKEASQRGVTIRIVLDANKDAFGREKGGIPNRQVASELTKENIKIRWYDTNGEQYHTKMILVKGKDRSTIIGGSANFTKRNIGDYNLETDLKIVAKNDSSLVKNIEDYFNQIWNNEAGTFTTEYETYQDDSLGKKILYRFQEFSGLSSF